MGKAISDFFKSRLTCLSHCHKFCHPVIFIITILIACSLIYALAIRPYNNRRILCRKCNIVVISIDTLRADALPCYGYRRNTARNLCRFADRNILFVNSYSQAPFTLPSTFSLLTSLYPSHHRVLQPYTDVLNPNIATLPQTLQSLGYETIYVGPLTDRHLPLDKGLERGFDIFAQNEDYMGIDGWNKGYKKLLENNKQNKPTFLFFHTYAVHSSFLASRETKHIFKSDSYADPPFTLDELTQFNADFVKFVLEDFSLRIKEGGPPESIAKLREYYETLIRAKDFQQMKNAYDRLPKIEKETFRHERFFQQIDRTSKEQIDYLRDLYDERIYQLDLSLTTLFSLLENPDISNNTIIIITSDHGEEFAEHGQLEHGINIYNTSTHVPLIMRVPGVESRRIQEPSQVVDIYPTILALLDRDQPSWLDGKDLSSLVVDSYWATDRYAISEYNDPFGRSYPVKSIATVRWKLYLIQTESGMKYELYDLLHDPNEQNNIAVNNKTLIEVLSKKLFRLINKN